MDINIFIIGLIMPFLLTLLALIVNLRSAGGFLLAGFSFLGGIIAVWFFLALGSDGSLTQLTGTTNNVIASAATGNVWTYLTLLPLVLAMMSFCAAMFRGWEST